MVKGFILVTLMQAVPAAAVKVLLYNYYFFLATKKIYHAEDFFIAAALANERNYCIEKFCL
jgi:hypothetical protein